MAQLVEVRFKGTRKAFFRYDGSDSDRLRLEDPVVVVAERGLDFGRISATGDTAVSKCGGACRSCSTGDAVAEGNTGRLVADEVGSDAVSPLDAALAVHAAAGSMVPEGAVAVLESGFVDFGPEAPEPAPEYPQPDVTPEYLASLARIVRRASPDDVKKANELRRGEEVDRIAIIRKVRDHKLDMKVSDAEWQFDRSRLVVYFSSVNRVDFRNLVKELATQFRTRLELRQIGIRDEAARLGGIGRCGKEFCCTTWLTDLSPVNLSLAKDQHLSLNPQQISGGCGRLLCCLRYEHEFYVASRKRFPKDGKSLYTLRGKERVVAVDIFRERVFLRSDEHGPRIVPLIDLQDEQAQATAAGIGPDNPVGIVPVANVAPGRMSPVQRAAEQAVAEALAAGEPVPTAPVRKPSEPRRERPERTERPRGRDNRPPRPEPRAVAPDAPAKDETRGPGQDAPRGERPPRGDRPRDERPRRAERPSDGRPSDGRPREERPSDERPRDERPRRNERPSGERPRSEDGSPDAPAAGTNAPRGNKRNKRGRGPRPEGEAPNGPRSENDRPRGPRPPASEGSTPRPADGEPNTGAPTGGDRNKRGRRRGRGPRPDGSSSSES